MTICLLAIIIVNFVLASTSFAQCQGSSPNWTVATPYSAKDVQDCVNIARNGDVINIPSANLTWNTTVVIPNTKGVKIIGAGIGNTRVTGSAEPKIEVRIASGNNTFTRISGIEFYDSSAHGISLIQTTAYGVRSKGRYRVDNCSFNYHKGIRTWGNAYGVVDACEFYHTDGYHGYQMMISGITGKPSTGTMGNDLGYQDWSEPVSYGTEYMHVWENNLISFTQWSWSGQVQNWNDGHAGGRVMFRHNTVLNGIIPGGHDACTNSRRGFHSVEMYGNTFRTTENIWSLNYSRGGGFLIYDNTFQLYNLGVISPLYFPNPVYRYPASSCGTPWNVACSATSGKICIKALNSCKTNADCTWVPNDSCVNLDGNDGGYPCRDQFGFAGNDMTSNPVMGWNNLWCKGSPNCTPNQHAAITWPSQDDHVIKRERDVIDFNSLTNIGTCNDGIDNNGDGLADMKDPVCIQFWDATNHRKKNYTPLKYPHPLRKPDAPRGVKLLN